VPQAVFVYSFGRAVGVGFGELRVGHCEYSGCEARRIGLPLLVREPAFYPRSRHETRSYNQWTSRRAIYRLNQSSINPAIRLRNNQLRIEQQKSCVFRKRQKKAARRPHKNTDEKDYPWSRGNTNFIS
jgi:hypothetical protein